MAPHIRHRVDGDIDAAIAALTNADSPDDADRDLTEALFERILVDLRDDVGSRRLTPQQYADELAALARQARSVGLFATL